MKAILIILLLGLTCFPSDLFSQVYKNRATEVAYKYNDSHGRWSKWSDWTNCDILVVTDLDKETFTIYSKEAQEFDIVNYYEKEYDAEGVEVFRMFCVDKEGIRCNIRERFVDDGVYFAQLYVDYADFMYVYNLAKNR